ncbi:DUF4239 domain-containing protein [Bradyrhizobium lablabi]|uniref:bestrophin-like domain n=1 Tax=Bradyrhizobium lablabi TaxID=722472 RepID=UPI001BA52EEE|nr:DUF4239 domain-containing protein [Bradyrhizobium lablabi]MBR1123046.1 DUF4239 domain-containing protein [Bradyrhizobium lablabi]
MSSTTAFIASFIAILVGAAGAMWLRRHPSVAALDTGSRDLIRLGAGFLATLAALVIGLMIASAKNFYDSQSINIRQLGANAVLADQMLGKYGPEAKAARSLLRDGTTQAVARIWQENRGHVGGSTFVVSETGERFYNAIEALRPVNDEQRSLKSPLGQVTGDLARTRLLVFTQSDNAIPIPFFIVLVFWLIVIFGSFCLFAQTTRIVNATVVVFALSVSSALFLIVDLSHPFEGLMQVSDHHLRVVLPELDK